MLNSANFRITKFLEPRSEATFGAARAGTALIVLNSSLSDIGYVRRLYEHASFCVCADGGANRLHDLTTQADTQTEDIQRILPDVIHGDLDSLDPNVRNAYEKLGVPVTHDPDQYSTDFGKSVKLVLRKIANLSNILILGSLGGRVDQGIGLLHELYREQKDCFQSVRFWLFSESSISIILAPGKTVIETPLDTGLIRHSVGILPLYGPARITTMGLEWDVTDWMTQIGGQVSTSNHIVHSEVSVTTDNPVLFTVEKPDKL